ncbi:hypothetical protein ACWEP4_40525 [Streptomyces sp. NPDC004227]
MQTTVIAVTGSREHPNPEIAAYAVADYVLNEAPGPVIVRHGACPGEQSVDQTVAQWIDECGELLGVTQDPMPADWDNCTPDCPADPGHRRRKKPGDTAHPGQLPDYCPDAGPRRNADMVAKQPQPAMVIAAPHGPSYGTRNCMRLAEAVGIRIVEVA